MKIRFSIRDLLWLTLVVALCMGWWLGHRQYADDWVLESFEPYSIKLRNRGSGELSELNLESNQSQFIEEPQR
jgi:hypothetical protein